MKKLFHHNFIFINNIIYYNIGRYVSPDAYIHYILPRLRGDKEVTSFGADTDIRITVMECLQVD